MECALQCNHDRRCLSITYHADYKLCMMKNHLKFDFNNYGNQKRPKCSDLKSYMFKVREVITDEQVNPNTPDRFTPSHAGCAENCGSALTHH